MLKSMEIDTVLLEALQQSHTLDEYELMERIFNPVMVESYLQGQCHWQSHIPLGMRRQWHLIPVQTRITLILESQRWVESEIKDCQRMLNSNDPDTQRMGQHCLCVSNQLTSQ